MQFGRTFPKLDNNFKEVISPRSVVSLTNNDIINNEV